LKTKLEIELVDKADTAGETPKRKPDA